MRRKPIEEEENVKEIAIRTEKELNQYFDSFEKTLKDTSRFYIYVIEEKFIKYKHDGCLKK